MLDAITAVEGLRVGHWSDLEAATGCTVVLCPEGAIASADVRGGAPGTRETDLLRPGNLIDRVHAILLAGGSAFGLDAAAGVMRWLEERGHGFQAPLREVGSTAVIPIVPGAIVFDLHIGQAAVRPGAAAGYAACEAATDGPPAEGSVGAGTGATVGKTLGMERAIKAGTGTAAERTKSGVTVGAIVIVNAFGEIVDPDTGHVVAGPRGETPGSFIRTLDVLRTVPLLAPGNVTLPPNSTIAVVATDAALTKEDVYRLSVMAQSGLTRTIVPVHTPLDGDTVFALATSRNQTPTDVLQIGSLAARALERAVLRAVRAATGLAGIPSAAEWRG